MSLTTSEMTPADIRACTCGNDGYSNGGGNGMWGDGAWWIIILLLFGYGRGFGGGFGGGGNAGANTTCASTADVYNAVDQQTLISKLDQSVYGQADVYNSLNNTLNQNFRNIDNAICTLGYQGAQHANDISRQANDISRQLADCCCKIEGDIERNTTQTIMTGNALDRRISDCCCDLEKMNMQNRFDAQAYNCNILSAIDASSDRILKYLQEEKTQALRDELQAYRLAASQERQNRYLVNELRPCPIPAYITCNPYAASYGFNGYNNGGCGCNGSF